MTKKKESAAVVAWSPFVETASEDAEATKLVIHVLSMFAQGMPIAPALLVSQSPETTAARELANELVDALEFLIASTAAPKKPAKAPASTEKEATARELAEVRAKLRIRRLAKARR